MKEIRILPEKQAEVRAEQDSRSITGYAIVWDTESRDLGGFTESIDPNALDGVFPDVDVVALYNHREDSGVLARFTNGKGTLELEVDEKGLRYTFDSPETSLGNDVLESVRRGDIRESSFAFIVGEDDFEKRDDGSYHRRITKFKDILDVSPVVRAAYGDTSVAKRKLENVLETEEKERLENEKQKLDQEEKELNEYFASLNEKINSLEQENEETK